MLVSASAGSGKTSVLTTRVFLTLTQSSAIPADRLLVITFSRAAANEMRERILSLLAAHSANNPGSYALRNQQILFQNANVCTIDSFCNKLVRENFEKLDISQNYNVADIKSLGPLRDKAIAMLFDQYYAAADSEFLSLVNFLYGDDDSGLAKIILQIYDYIRVFPFPLEKLSELCEDYTQTNPIGKTKWGRYITDEIGQAMEYACELNSRAINTCRLDSKVCEKYLPALTDERGMIESVRVACAGGRYEDLYGCIHSISFARIICRDSKDHTVDKDVKSQVDSYRNIYREMIADFKDGLASASGYEYDSDIAYQRAYVQKLSELTREFYHKLEVLKAEQNLLDYADLELLAVRLLVTKTEDGYKKTKICRQLSEFYHEILLDEYQDTNETQDLIFSCLSRESGNLFMVGDVKQSIYSFRQARPDIFVDKFIRYADHGQGDFPAKIILNNNFRSNSCVIDSVNGIFRRIFSSRIGGIDYSRDQELISNRNADREYATEFHAVTSDQDDIITAEAEYIAAKINSMIASGFAVQDKDGMRPCRAGDFAVLMRSVKERSDIFAKTLTQSGLRVFAKVSVGYFGSYEISLMLDFLRVLDNPALNLPMLAVMMSHIGRFTPDEMAQMRGNDKKTSLISCLVKQSEGSSKAEEFLAMIKRLRDYSMQNSIERLITKIYDDTAMTEISDEQGRANLRMFLTHAANYESSGIKSLSGFLRYIEKIIAGSRDFESANIFSDTSDAVKIMSIHASKGLEFPIVILASCHKRFNEKDLSQTMLFHDSLGISLVCQRPDQMIKYKPLQQYAIQNAMKYALYSEEMRVLYVALTRAREKLIITAVMPDLDQRRQKIAGIIGDREWVDPYTLMTFRCYADWLLAALSSDHQSVVIVSNQQFDRSFAITGHGAGDIPPLSPEDVLPPERRGDSFSFIYPHRSPSIPAKFSVTQIVSKKSDIPRELSSRPEFVKALGLTAAERGTAMHDFLQFADFAAAQNNLESEIERLTRMGFISKLQSESLYKNSITTFLNSDLAAVMQGGKRLIREFKFMDKIKAANISDEYKDTDDEVLIQGIVDCICESDDGLVIVDYKTDKIEDIEELAERYKLQLELYKNAIQKIFGKPVKDAYIYSFYLNKGVAVTDHPVKHYRNFVASVCHPSPKGNWKL
ncbi:MAG: UvrD-helicase domain-containing protein [Oscillospiraceae bacterium]|nr:UvrD-helicase domain-containing protein [Oscillospiraceae bacterium]